MGWISDIVNLFRQQQPPNTATGTLFTPVSPKPTSSETESSETEPLSQPITSINECGDGTVAVAAHSIGDLRTITNGLPETLFILKELYKKNDSTAITDLTARLQQSANEKSKPPTILQKILLFLRRQKPPEKKIAIRPIAVLVLEINLGNGGDPPTQESIDLIRKTLEANPNAIIVIVTSSPENAAPALREFQNHHVYYRTTTENPFRGGSEQHLNDSCVNARGNLENLITAITKLPKYKRLVPSSIYRIASDSSASSPTPTNNSSTLVSTHNPKVESTVADNSPRHPDDFILDSPTSNASSTILGSPNKHPNKHKNRRLRFQVVPINPSHIGASLDNTTIPPIPSNNLGSLALPLGTNNTHHPKK